LLWLLEEQCTSVHESYSGKAIFGQKFRNRTAPARSRIANIRAGTVSAVAKSAVFPAFQNDSFIQGTWFEIIGNEWILRSKGCQCERL